MENRIDSYLAEVLSGVRIQLGTDSSPNTLIFRSGNSVVWILEVEKGILFLGNTFGQLELSTGKSFWNSDLTFNLVKERILWYLVQNYGIKLKNIILSPMMI